MVVGAAARPLYTDDAWWHLAYGEAFLEQGPWLFGDPLLFAAAGPAAPASWLFDVALVAVWQHAGFTGLRALHALAVIGVIALAYHGIRRVSDSTAFAACGTAVFAGLSAYRLFQLRPELVTIAATLLLFSFLIAPRVSWRTSTRVVGAACLGAVWSNTHAAFLLAPILLLAAALGVSSALLIHGPNESNTSWDRVRRLLTAAAASALGSLLNPSGYAALLPFAKSGASTPDLTRVYDEWIPFEFLRLPHFGGFPTPFDWLLVWVLLLCTMLGIGSWILWGKRADSFTREVDPALIALSCAAWIAIAIAVRFEWLAVFPIMLVGQMVRGARMRACAIEGADSRGVLRAWAASIVALLLVPGFLFAGTWSQIARGLPKSWEGYSAPYAIGKHAGHAAWFLRDTKLAGNLLAPYSSGGFLGFWLAPALRVLVAGSLNVEPDVMRSYLAIQQRRGIDGKSFEELLTDLDVDVFLGTQLPGYRPNRPRPFMTTHLERSPGWVLVFRNLRSSVWLRDDPGNAENLARVERYYAMHDVPFEASRGFDPLRVASEAPEWSVRHALSPADLPALERMTRAPVEDIQPHALARLAGIRASLGQYAAALDLDAQIIAWRPDDREALRRRLWCLLHLDRGAEAVEVADRLEGIPGRDSLDQLLAQAARRYVSEPSRGERAAQIASLPLLSRDQAGQLTRGFVPASLPTERSPAR